MTIADLRTARSRLENDISALLDRFQQEAGAGVWVAVIDSGRGQGGRAAAVGPIHRRYIASRISKPANTRESWGN